MTVPQPTPSKKPRIGCGSASESAWWAWAVPLTGQLLGLDSTAPPAMGVTWSSKYIERTRGVSKIARRRWNRWSASYRLPYPAPRGRSCYVGQVTPRAKSGSSRICAQRASVSDPVRWIPTQAKYLWTGFHLVPHSTLYPQYNPKYTTFKFVLLFWDTRYILGLTGRSSIWSGSCRVICHPPETNQRSRACRLRDPREDDANPVGTPNEVKFGYEI